jgi:hypothetical protein
MTRFAVLSAICALSVACAGPGRVSVRPGTDVALPEPPAPGAAVIAGAICIFQTAERKDGDACPQRSDSLRPVTRTPTAVRKPQMRVRTTTSVFRRG